LNMSRFRSAEEATARFLDPEPELARLIELYGGEYNPADGPAGLCAETQRLWVPHNQDGMVIKVPDIDVPSRDRRYSEAVRCESWRLLEALGCLDGFVPSMSQQYGMVLAHGTLPLYAKANFDLLVDLTNQGLMVGDDIFMLSAPYMVRDPELPGLDSFNDDLIQQPSKWRPAIIPITEAASMAWLWEHTPKSSALERMRVTTISSSDAKTPDGPWYIPDTGDSLQAMHQCCFDPKAADEYDKLFAVRSYLPAETTVDPLAEKPVLNILNLAATIEQLLRQHVLTRAFFRRQKINCQIHTICARTNVRGSLFLRVRPVLPVVAADHAKMFCFRH
jgi:hypothetical protein